ncbi:MAG: HD domain-containing protein [Rhodospirillaceae bacterium]|nr:HD domain-containing protein [Rhodospirillaceae bacterium]
MNSEPSPSVVTLSANLLPALRDAAILKELPARVVKHLKALDDEEPLKGRFGAVSRFTHCLQTATLAHKGGEDDEYVALALVHDIGDILGPYNHGEFAATLMAPFLTEANHWMVAHHHCFQGYYYFQYLGLDKNMREQFRGHPHFERTIKFCEAYDEKAFDPKLDTMPIEAFMPVLRRVMLNPKRTIFIPGSAVPGTVF